MNTGISIGVVAALDNAARRNVLTALGIKIGRYNLASKTNFGIKQVSWTHSAGVESTRGFRQVRCVSNMCVRIRLRGIPNSTTGLILTDWKTLESTLAIPLAKA